MALAVGPGESWSALGMRVCVCAQVWNRHWSGVWSWGSMCPGASNQRDWDPEAATGQTESLSPAAAEIHLVRTYMCVCVYINIYISILPSEPSSYSERGAGEGMSVCDLCGWSCIYVCMCCVCVLCVHVPTVNASLAMLLAGHGDMKLQQPCLLWAAKSGMINFPLTDGTVVGSISLSASTLLAVLSLMTSKMF